MLQFTLLSFRKHPISRNLGFELLINFHHYLVIKKTFHSCDICELPDGCPHDLQTTNHVKAPQLMKNFTYKSLYNEFVIIICLTFTSGPHRSLVLLLIWIQYTHQSPGHSGAVPIFLCITLLAPKWNSIIAFTLLKL